MPRGLVTLATIAGVGAALALPAASGAQAPAQDSVTGAGTSGLCGGDGRVEVDARSGPSGESPTGQVRCGTLFSGPVSCLAVSGNVALLTVQSSLFGPRCSGPSESGSPTPERRATSSRRSPATAARSPSAPHQLPLQRRPRGGRRAAAHLEGTVQERRWRSFGVFRNQGDCVSFVATGGKNPPAG